MDEDKAFFGMMFLIVLVNIVFWAAVIALGFYAVNKFAG